MFLNLTVTKKLNYNFKFYFFREDCKIMINSIKPKIKKGKLEFSLIKYIKFLFVFLVNIFIKN